MLSLGRTNITLLAFAYFAFLVLSGLFAGDYLIIGKGQLLWSKNIEPFLLLMAFAMLVSAWISHRMLLFSYELKLGVIAGVTLLVFMAASVVLLLGRIYYSRLFILFIGMYTTIGIILWAWLVMNYRKMVLGYVPYGVVSDVIAAGKKNMSFVEIDLNNYNYRDFDVVIADLHAELPAGWYRFLAECLLAKKKVGHAATLYEMLTGRIMLSHISEMQLEDFSPSIVYRIAKRIFDLFLAILLLPLFIVIIAIAAVAIKLSSRGGAFYSQPRIGEGGKVFTIYKLRTMYRDKESNDPQFATKGDARITWLGHFLRKTRMDELPQIFNILKGDMSWIGPRPEQKYFVDDFEKNIPYYGYRHVLKPGITGWAQVMHGYAADLSSTEEKLVYDFYYIKHASIWLDVYVIYRTLVTVLTGFGAR